MTIIDGVSALAVDDRAEHYLRPRIVKKPAARLIVFPYAGASAVAYFNWAKFLDPDIELISIQYPGRGRLAQIPPCKCVEDLVEESYATVSLFRDAPLYFFGHSMGAAVAFELSRRLQANNEDLPKALFVSSCASPRSSALSMKISRLSDDEFIHYLARYGGVRDEILQSSELISFFMPLLRADMAAIESWHCDVDAPLDVPIIVIGGDQDEVVRPSQLEGWRDFTISGFERHVLRGGHFYFQDQLQDVAGVIQRAMKKTIGSS